MVLMATEQPTSTIEGWENIAKNIGVKSISTAKEYEKRRGLPVRRMGGKVYADENELYIWKVRENNRRRKEAAKKRRAEN